MRIGIVGSGNMGKALGRSWAAAGHDVFFGSNDPAKAAAAAKQAGTARAGSLEEAAAFGEVILYTVRDVLPSRLLTSPAALTGKTVVDCRNSAILGMEVPDPEHRPGVNFASPTPSMAEQLAADIPGASVVKAFNTLAADLIALGRDALAPHHISAFVCADDPAAKIVVQRLAVDAGFLGVDSGELYRARLVEGVGDFIRLQMTALGLGTRATTSVRVF